MEDLETLEDDELVALIERAEELAVQHRTRRIDAMVALRDRGWSLRRIGEAAGISPQAVHQHITKGTP